MLRKICLIEILIWKFIFLIQGKNGSEGRKTTSYFFIILTCVCKHYWSIFKGDNMEQSQ